MLRALVLVLCVSLVICQTTFYEATNPNLQWSGRVQYTTDDSNAPVIRYDWSGVQVQFQVSGTTSVYMYLDDANNYYNVFVDNKYWTTLATTNPGTYTQYTLATNLDATQQHHVKITKATEAEVYSTPVCSGFALDINGVLLPPISPPSRRLEFLGDSITCGYGNMATDCPGNTAEGLYENNYYTYGQMLARYFNAEVHVESWSGKGLVRNYDDPNTSSPNPFPIYFNRTIGTDPAVIYNFTQFIPDAVVINLGTNDFSTEPTPSQAQFQLAYRAFLQTIREAYGNRKMTFFLACGPMISNPCCYYVENVVRHESDTYFLNLQNLLDEDDLGCDGHPNVAGHQKMAYASIPIISAAMGW